MEAIFATFMDHSPFESTMANLKLPGNRKRGILRIEEVTWRLKSRINWLAEGDQNTNFFHKCANERKNRNVIWCIKNSDDSYAISNFDIQRESHRYFSSFYHKEEWISGENQVWLLEHVHLFFYAAAISSLENSITGN